MSGKNRFWYTSTKGIYKSILNTRFSHCHAEPVSKYLRSDLNTCFFSGDAPHYRGPEQIQGYYDAANKKIKRKVLGVVGLQQAPFPEDSQRHFLTLWFSGAREGEAVMLDPKGWTWNEEAIGYVKTPVLKKRETVTDELGNPVYYAVTVKERQPDGSIQDKIIYRKESRPRLEYRDVLVPRDYPLAEELRTRAHLYNAHAEDHSACARNALDLSILSLSNDKKECVEEGVTYI